MSLRIIKAALLYTVIIFAAFSANPAGVFSQGTGVENPQVKKLTRDDHIEAGKLYYRAKKFEAAVQEWEEASLLDPGNNRIKAYIENAKKKIELRRKNNDEAKKRFDEEMRRKDEAEKKEAPPETKPEPKKRKGWFNWFRKETGLISIATPPREAALTHSLDDCINIAVNNHIPLLVAEKSIRLAQMRILEARRNMLPSATIDYEQYSGRVQGRAYIGRKQYIEGQQPIFHGGELYYTMKQAETNLEVVKNDYKRIKNELILQVKKGYYSLQKARENRELQIKLDESVGKIYDMVKKGYDAGVISRVEFLNVGSQASQVKYQLVSAEGDGAMAELILKQAMNVDMKQKVEIEQGPEFKKVDVDLEEALHLAMINRPEIKISSLMVDYYNYGKSIAKAKGWPKVDFIGNWGLAREEYAPEDLSTDPDRKMEQQWYAVIKASMPFWGSTGEYSWTKETWVPVVSAYQGTETVTSAWKLKVLDKLDYFSDRQLSEVDFDNARQDLVKKKQDITLEARESCFNYQKALVQLDTAANKVKYQETDLEFTKLKRGMDEVQDSSVVEGMIKLAQEKFGYVQALSDCHISLASINKAIGVADYYKDEKK